MAVATLLDTDTVEQEVLPPITELDSKSLTLSPEVVKPQLLSDRSVMLSPISVAAQLLAQEKYILEPTEVAVELLTIKTVVLAPLDMEEEPTPAPAPPPAGINWWLWGGIAAIAITIVLFIVARRGGA